MFDSGDRRNLELEHVPVETHKSLYFADKRASREHVGTKQASTITQRKQATA